MILNLQINSEYLFIKFENIKLLFEMRNSTPSSNLRIMKTVGDMSDKKLTKYMNLLSKHVDYIEINQIIHGLTAKNTSQNPS